MKFHLSSLPYFNPNSRKERILTFLLYGALPTLVLVFVVTFAILRGADPSSSDSFSDASQLSSGNPSTNGSLSGEGSSSSDADPASEDTSDSSEISAAAPSEQERFDTYLGTVFAVAVSENTLSLHYKVSNPANYGIQAGEVTWGSATLTELWDSCQATRALFAKLSDYDYDLLTKEQQLCYRLLEAVAATLPEDSSAYLYDSVFSPTTGVQAQIPVLLAEYSFDSKEDIENYLSLIELLPDYFSSLLTLEKARIESGIPLPSVLAERVISQCQAIWEQTEDCFLIEVFDDKIAQFSDDVETLSEAEIADYTERHDLLILNSYLPAYRLVATTLKELASEDADVRGLSWYEGGAAWYETLAQSQLGTARTMEEYIEMADAAIAEDLQQIYLLLVTDSELSETVLSLDELFADATPEEILNHLSEAVLVDFPSLSQAAGSALSRPEASATSSSTGAVTASDTRFTVKYVDSALADTLSPAFYLIPQIDSRQTNVIYLNSAKLSGGNALFTTLAHEGFPGHLYQTSYFYSTDPHPVRQLYAWDGYVEGWATYAEILSFNYMGLSANLTSLLKHNQSFTLGVYCRIDIGVNYEGWLLTDVCSYLDGFGLDGASYAEEIFYTMVEEPGNYLKYYLGYLELTELAEKAAAAGMGLPEFHEQVLTLGPLPFSLLEEYLEF
ncbi:MAG: DUF885 domain-containing protein [Lachnospiraceae bacterium]|nr:DUF885 domain-containing protein [Lachnospiraceae bacterium]